jgi:hypothetical protein
VQADERQARAYGANAVPFFVFDSTYGVSGAQAPEVFANVLERAWSEADGSIEFDAGSGEDAACDDEACAVPHSGTA